MSQGRWASVIGTVLTVAGLFFVGMASAQARMLSFDDRVAAQKAIEQVYWNHRIWPQENPGPKPPLSAVMSDDAIRAKVEDDLKKSNALERWWQRPVTAEQLQAELDRMAEGTKDGAMLQELYRALGDDPFVIAETLARQTLVDRLIRSWQATDTRFHATERPRGLEETQESFDVWWAGARGDLGSEIEPSSETFSVPAVPSTACTNDAWSPTRMQVPDPRTAHTAVWTGTEMIVWGGNIQGSAPGNTGGRYNPATDNWTLTSTGTNVPAARAWHTAVWTGTEMIVWGGSTLSSKFNTGGRYNPATDNWTSTSTGMNLPAARDQQTAVWTGTMMIVWGGFDGTSELNTGGRYSPAGDTWLSTSTGANDPTARRGHTAVWTGSRMVVWGGVVTGVGSLGTGGRYNSASDSWEATSIGVNVPAARFAHAAVWTGTEMIVWGGQGAAYLNTGGRYNPSTDAWSVTPMGAGLPSGRSGHTVLWTSTEMIVWGGSGDSAETNTGGRYNPTTGVWTATSIGPNAPLGRTGQTAVWTGTEMIVWGGSRGGLQMNTGGRFNPSTESWAATSLDSSVPAARRDHTVVWTGTEMIVWGGGNASFLNTGGRYVPSTDNWTPTSTGANLPSPRIQNTAVWTGTEMIVWGGYDGSVLNSGGRYSPASDTWSSTSTLPNVPLGRRDNSAVWTGTEMIVWGGYSGSSKFNTGGRYKPATDSWTATSTGAGVPAARYKHTAVWTGEEMIVWGGFNDVTWFSTGGRYNPSSNSWTTTAGPGEAAARYLHTAVWTGTDMIVWGGDLNGGSLNTGGRYRASTGNWTATSTGVNVPTARSGHTAVWTGTEMIVWGASSSSTANAGGRYNASADTWTATSTAAPVPKGRDSHSAVWTGTEMIIWGGTPTTSSGGRYCGCPSGRISYRDLDGDGYGDASVSSAACDGLIPAGYVIDNTDCNDASAFVHPNATERCNGVDDNCDLAVDNGGAVMCSDANVCTNDLCNGVAGCAQANNAASCDDGNACTTGDACSNGSCSGTGGAAAPDVGSVSAAKSNVTAVFDWSATLGAIAYDVLRGRVGEWPLGSSPVTETCLAENVFGTTAMDAAVPAADDGYWYLVRADYACGSGSYGAGGSHGVPATSRLSGTCP